MSDEGLGVFQARADVVGFQPRVDLQQICGVSLAVNMPRTCLTASRRFLMIGLPPKMAWFDVIRRRRSVSLQVLVPRDFCLHATVLRAEGVAAVVPQDSEHRSHVRQRHRAGSLTILTRPSTTREGRPMKPPRNPVQ